MCNVTVCSVSVFGYVVVPLCIYIQSQGPVVLRLYSVFFKGGTSV